MIKLKSEEGKCHLQMSGSQLDLAGDTITALDAIMHGLHKAGAYSEATNIKEAIKAWTEGYFDD
mgnify:CR=1 FL=1